jgi:chemotaxis protein methyltransferase CheR
LPDGQLATDIATSQTRHEPLLFALSVQSCPQARAPACRCDHNLAADPKRRRATAITKKPMNTTPHVVAPSLASPEFLLTDNDFAKIRTLIHQRAGIALGAQKRQMVYSRLSRRLRDLGLKEFSAYLRHLESDPRSDEWQSFTNALTTNLTAFFRESHHFPVLAEHVKKCAQPVTIWCSAASTGEEPYSIAMTLIEALGSRAGNASVVATDIDTQVC